MKLPWQKSDTPSASGSTRVNIGSASASAGESASTSVTPAATGDAHTAKSETKLPKGYTPPKGRPTPKRHDQEVKRGVVRDPNAVTTAQAAQKRKELKASLSKEEWKAYKQKEREERRAQNRELQARMDAGDERYLLDRDKGEVRRYTRDWVDSRRFLSNYLMPGAFALLVVMLIGLWLPRVAEVLSLVSMVFILAMVIEGFVIGIRANRAVRAKFPDTTETGFGLGTYAFSRASQPRNWRTPKPQVSIGASV